jgi:hypothetical protein
VVPLDNGLGSGYILLDIAKSNWLFAYTASYSLFCASLWTEYRSTVKLVYVATIEVKLKSPRCSRILNSETSGIFGFTIFQAVFPNRFEAVK